MATRTATRTTPAAARPKAAPGARRSFSAKILTQGPGGAWPCMDLPFDVHAAWGTRARVSVKGTMNGFPFRTSIFPNGDGTHHMMVNKAMRDGAKAAPGDSVKVVLEPDEKPRTVPVPPELRKALATAAKAKATFSALAPSHKRAYVEYITQAKKPETRARRVEQTVARLAGGLKPA